MTEKEYEEANKIVNKFLSANSYDSTSTPEVMESTFLDALDKFLTNDESDLFVLGLIAEEFEANPSIHLSSLKNEIYLAIDLVYFLNENLTEQLADHVTKLKEFQAKMKENFKS